MSKANAKKGWTRSIPGQPAKEAGVRRFLLKDGPLDFPQAAISSVSFFTGRARDPGSGELAERPEVAEVISPYALVITTEKAISC